MAPVVARFSSLKSIGYEQLSNLGGNGLRKTPSDCFKQMKGKRQFDAMIFKSDVSIFPRLRKQAKLSVTQPLSRPVSANDAVYLAHTGFQKLGWRQVRRAIYFRLSGQEKYGQARISADWKRGLWLYKGIPQIGDALMDLAPRCLLAEQGLTMDLYTDAHLAAMFADDPWLDRVLCNSEDVRLKNYDFVIVPSFKRRSLKEKIFLLPDTPWISMHGFYTGPEFHRGEFAAQRLADALSLTHSPTELAQHSRQKLKPLPRTEPAPAPAARIKLAIALGGVDPLRSYQNWLTLAQALAKIASLDITLLGSTNALDEARAFECQWAGPLHNAVNKTDLWQCRQLINEQDIVIACDGGLMHLTVTTPTQMVSLFTSTVEPAWRLPADRLDSALKSNTDDVNGIAPSKIVALVKQLIAKPEAALRPTPSLPPPFSAS